MYICDELSGKSFFSLTLSIIISQMFHIYRGDRQWDHHTAHNAQDEET